MIPLVVPLAEAAITVMTTARDAISALPIKTPVDAPLKPKQPNLYLDSTIHYDEFDIY